MTQKITEERFIELYIRTRNNKTIGQNAKELLERLESEGYIQVMREYE